MKAMNCVHKGSPEAFQLIQTAMPSINDHEVLVKISAALVTASDCITGSGSSALAGFFGSRKKSKENIMGVEFAGVVSAVGNQVKRFKVNDCVFGSAGLSYGAYAEYIKLKEDAVLLQKPEHIDFDEAACLCDGGLTAYNFLKVKAKLRPGQKVLIYGASGAVGTYAVQLAKYFGAVVTGVSGTGHIDLLKELGADQVIDYRNEDFTKNNQTYDVIFDAVGKLTYSRCKKSLNPKGIYLTTIPSLAILLQMLFTSGRRGKRAIFSATGLKKAADRSVWLKYLADLSSEGILKTIIDRYYPLEQMNEAHRYVGAGHKKGNVIITL
jgi:NADPH:quinone reductase-like Zn-dependent oxidoreductase